jgi:hypothetical protein
MRLPLFLRYNSAIAALVTLLCLLQLQTSWAAVLAIDYGTEWTKAALVKPGIPLQIVLTKDTKRKEQSVVAFKHQERLYGSDAFNLVSPQVPCSPIQFMLGKLADGGGGAISGGDVSWVEEFTGTDGGE